MRDAYRHVLVVASAAALADVLVKNPHAHVVTIEPRPAYLPPGPLTVELLNYAPTRRVDRDKPWRRWPVRR